MLEANNLLRRQPNSAAASQRGEGEVNHPCLLLRERRKSTAFAENADNIIGPVEVGIQHIPDSVAVVENYCYLTPR